MDKIIDQKWEGDVSFSTKDTFYKHIMQVIVPYVFYQPSVSAIAKGHNISRDSVYRYLQKGKELLWTNKKFSRIFFWYVKHFHTYCRTKDFEKNLNEYLCS